jgi:hypothetical protein
MFAITNRWCFADTGVLSPPSESSRALLKRQDLRWICCGNRNAVLTTVGRPITTRTTVGGFWDAAQFMPEPLVARPGKPRTMATNAPARYGWTTFAHATERKADAGSQAIQAAQQPSSSAENGTRPASINRFSRLALPKDKTIAISVIAGPSKGMMHQLSRPLVSIGRSGAGADIQVNDPKVSDVHCVIGVNLEMIRLCDLDSTSGTYIGDELVQTAGLEHLSEFRVGSSLLLITILPKCKI